jgi:hypothetical protein
MRGTFPLEASANRVQLPASAYPFVEVVFNEFPLSEMNCPVWKTTKARTIAMVIEKRAIRQFCSTENKSPVSGKL